MGNSSAAWIVFHEADDAARETLEAHLAPLMRAGKLEVAHRGTALPGGSIDSGIAAGIDAADVIVALISSDLISTDARLSELQCGAKLGKQIIPVVVRTCQWTEVDILRAAAEFSLPCREEVGKLLRGVPIYRWTDEDAYWKAVVGGFLEILRIPVAESKPTPAPPKKWKQVARIGLPSALALGALLMVTSMRRSQVTLPALEKGAAPGYPGVVTACAASASDTTRAARDALQKEINATLHSKQAYSVDVEEPVCAFWRGGSTTNEVLSMMQSGGFALLVMVEPDHEPDPEQRIRFLDPHHSLIPTLLNETRPIFSGAPPPDLAEAISALALVLGGRMNRAAFDVKVPEKGTGGDATLMLAVLARHFAGLPAEKHEREMLSALLDRRECGKEPTDTCCFAQALADARGMDVPIVQMNDCAFTKDGAWPLIAAAPQLRRVYQRLQKEGVNRLVVERVRGVCRLASAALDRLGSIRENTDSSDTRCGPGTDLLLEGVGWASGASFLASELQRLSGGRESIPVDARMACLARISIDAKMQAFPPLQKQFLAAGLEERAEWRGRAGDWKGAAADAHLATELSSDYAHQLSWGEKVLHAEQAVEDEALRRALADRPAELPDLRLYAAFLRWLFDQRAKSDTAEEIRALGDIYAQMPVDAQAISDDDGALENLVCVKRPAWSGNACDVYRVLHKERSRESDLRLAEALSARAPPGVNPAPGAGTRPGP